MTVTRDQLIDLSRDLQARSASRSEAREEFKKALAAVETIDEIREFGRMVRTELLPDFPEIPDDPSTREHGTLALVPKIVPLSEVVPESVTWLWPGRIPFGKLTILDGDPGLGKSTLTLDLAARLTTGREMPGGSDAETAAVLLLSAEDGLADTVRPRLDAAGADSSRVFALPAISLPDGISSLPNLADHLPQIQEAMHRTDARLLIVDPLMAYLGQVVNSYRDQDVRSLLAPLAAIAEKTGVAIVLVRHLRKGSRADGALYAGGGSIGIAGAARSVLLVAKDPDDESRRILAPVKSNLSKPSPSLAYRIAEDELGRPRIAWEESPVEITADRLLAASGEATEERTAREEVAGRLRELLADGPVPEKQVCAELGVGRAVSERTYRRARHAIGIVSSKSGFGTGWTLRLPEDGQPEPKTANTDRWQRSGQSGRLRACGYHVGRQASPCERCARSFSEHLRAIENSEGDPQ